MTAQKPKLTAIAAYMRQQLAGRNGLRTTPLSGGLELCLLRNGQRWTLTIQRPNVPPSEHEIRICRAAFAVPDEPGTRAFKHQLRSPKTGQPITYHGVELSWLEIPTPEAAAISNL